jgi:N-methylhydantoinase B
LANESIEPSAPIDPVTHEIIQGRLLSVVDEMTIVMTKTSMIPVVLRDLDFTCGICKSDQRPFEGTNQIHRLIVARRLLS